MTLTASGNSYHSELHALEACNAAIAARNVCCLLSKLALRPSKQQQLLPSVLQCFANQVAAAAAAPSSGLPQVGAPHCRQLYRQ